MSTALRAVIVLVLLAGVAVLVAVLLLVDIPPSHRFSDPGTCMQQIRAGCEEMDQ